MASRHANDRDRRFLASLKTASLERLLAKYRAATFEWKRVAIARAIERRKKIDSDGRI